MHYVVTSSRSDNFTLMRCAAVCMALALLFLMLWAPSAWALQGSNRDSVAHAGVEDASFDGLSGDGQAAADALAVNASIPYWQSSYGISSFKQNGKMYTVKGVEAICIDVSQWQSTIDWNKVKLDGIKYAIIRCGYGDDLAKQDDSQWLNNVRGAQRVGIGIGVYLYSYAYNTTMAKSEAQHTLRLLQEAGLKPADLALPVYFDFEDSKAIATMKTASAMGKVVETYCNAISDAGYPVGVYANTSTWNGKLTDSRVMDPINGGKWSRWVAHYHFYCGVGESAPSGTVVNASEGYKSLLDIWQFSDQGKIAGVSGKVDTDFVFDCGLVPVSKAKFSTNYTVFNYNGNRRVPKVTVTYGGNVLEEGVDYELVAPEGSSKVGSYTLKVKGMGRFYGTKKISYTVRPAAVSISKVTAAKKAFKLNWTPNAVQTFGYQICYSRTSGFSSYSTKTVAGTASCSKKVSVAKSKQKYYVKIRAYRTVDGVKYYSSWSPKVTVTTK